MGGDKRDNEILGVGPLKRYLVLKLSTRLTIIKNIAKHRMSITKVNKIKSKEKKKTSQWAAHFSCVSIIRS